MPSRPSALVLAGGTLPSPELWPLLLEGHDLVVAADGGLAHARILGLTPDLLVGDLDSVSARDLGRHSSVAVERHPTAKNELDLELALAAAWARGMTSATVAGAFGDRLDQSLGALLIAGREAEAGREVSLFGANHEARLAAAGGSVKRDLAAGTTVSLLALTPDCVVSTAGVAYPLRAAALPFGAGLGLSNAATGGTVSVEAHSGVVAVLVEHPAPDPREAIWGAQAGRIEAAISAADPDLAALVGSVVYADVLARGGLALATRELLSVALLTAVGGEAELTTHLRGAMRAGASEQQVREAIIQAAVFVGFPKALAAMRAFQRYLDDRA